MLKSDLRSIGHKDVLAAVEYLRGLDTVVPDEIVLAGHSIGASFALEAALADDRVAALAMVGMEAEIEEARPRNVLWAVGLYDEFRPVAALRQAMAVSSASDGIEGVTVGDFATGSARRLGVSGSADHFVEFQNAAIHGEIVDWFLLATGRERAVGVGWVARSRLVYFVGWVVLWVGLLMLMHWALHGRERLWRLVPVGAAVLFYVLAFFRGGFFSRIEDAMLLVLFVGFLGGYVCSEERERLRGALAFVFRFGLTLWLTLIVTLFVNSVPVIVGAPAYLMVLPEFSFLYPIALVKNYLFLHARQFLFSSYGTGGLVATPFVLLLLGVELVKPGGIIRFVVRTLGRIRRPAKPKGEQAKKPVAGMVVFGILVIVLGVIGLVRFQQGFLTGESGRAALVFMGRYGLVGIGVFLLAWRLIGKSRVGRKKI